jgi:cytochrome c553
MKTSCLFYVLCLLLGFTVFIQCTEKQKEVETTNQITEKTEFAGYASQEKWGEHLVLIAGCHDCHTPKKMGPNGPELDMDNMLSGHPAVMPPPAVNRNEAESKGLVVTQTLTAWVGPWGISYAANLTSDPSGIGNWQEGNFITAIRKGKFKGLETERDLLPPMPWQMFNNMSDDELKAIFAYLKSTKPINNVVPQPNQPVLARK